MPQFFYLIHQRVAGEMNRRGWLIRRVLRALIAANVALRDRFGWNPGRRVFARVHHALGPHMRLLITGGSRFDPTIARDLYGLGVSLYNGYGLTETSGAAAIMRPGDQFTTSVGQPLVGVDVRIAPRTDEVQGEADGEIAVALLAEIEMQLFDRILLVASAHAVHARNRWRLRHLGHGAAR